LASNQHKANAGNEQGGPKKRGNGSTQGEKIYQEDHQVSPENTGRISKVLIKIQ